MEIPTRHVIRRRASVTVGCDPSKAFAYISDSADLHNWLCKAGPIAGVQKVDVVAGPYDQTGARRIVTFKNGDTIQEELVDWMPSASYAYRVSAFSDFLRKLTDAAYGEFWFERKEGRTKIKWEYSYTYKNGFARCVLWIFNTFFFVRFMQAGLKTAKTRLEQAKLS